MSLLSRKAVSSFFTNFHAISCCNLYTRSPNYQTRENLEITHSNSVYLFTSEVIKRCTMGIQLQDFQFIGITPCYVPFQNQISVFIYYVPSNYLVEVFLYQNIVLYITICINSNLILIDSSAYFIIRGPHNFIYSPVIKYYLQDNVCYAYLHFPTVRI